MCWLSDAISYIDFGMDQSHSQRQPPADSVRFHGRFIYRSSLSLYVCVCVSSFFLSFKIPMAFFAFRPLFILKFQSSFGSFNHYIIFIPLPLFISWWRLFAHPFDSVFFFSSSFFSPFQSATALDTANFNINK